MGQGNGNHKKPRTDIFLRIFELRSSSSTNQNLAPKYRYTNSLKSREDSRKSKIATKDLLLRLIALVNQYVENIEGSKSILNVEKKQREKNKTTNEFFNKRSTYDSINEIRSMRSMHVVRKFYAEIDNEKYHTHLKQK